MIRDLLANSVHSFANNSILLMVLMFPETLTVAVFSLQPVHIYIYLPHSMFPAVLVTQMVLRNTNIYATLFDADTVPF